MVTRTTDKLSHEEALELLPWHVNATLDESTAGQVAEHVEQCSECQEESAVLASTVFALNTEADYGGNLDSRFSKLMTRVREHEREIADAGESRSFMQTLTGWFGLNPAPTRWAGAFAVGALVGAIAIFTALRPAGTGTLPPDAYEVHENAGASPLTLVVGFSSEPDAATLTDVQHVTPDGVNWQRVSPTEYVVTFPAGSAVDAVAGAQTRLKTFDAVETVHVDLVSGESASTEER